MPAAWATGAGRTFPLARFRRGGLPPRRRRRAAPPAGASRLRAGARAGGDLRRGGAAHRRLDLAGEDVDVVDALVAAAVDEERRRPRDAAGIRALDVLGDARRVL